MNIRFLIITISSCIFLFSNCQSDSSKIAKKKNDSVASKTAFTKKIMLLPLGKINNATVKNIFDSLQQIFPDVVLMKKELMPAFAYTGAPRHRYRADTLIHWMKRRAKENEVYLGITSFDISSTKKDTSDYGIMGLGYRPGNACVASDFRVKVKSNFFKIAIHELGHTAGLKHCPEKTCFMRDAESHDPTGEEKEFCKLCKNYLINKGWNL
jgi:archaemetzincin